MGLSAKKEKSAIAYNDDNMARVGWTRRYPDVATLLGLPDGASPGQFAQALSKWQDRQKPNMTDDGKLGSGTWGKMQSKLKVGATRPIPIWVKMPLPKPKPSPVRSLGLIGAMGSGPDWMKVLAYEMMAWDWFRAGLDAKKKKNTEAHTNWDEEYFAASPFWGAKKHAFGELPKTQNMDWCAAFANFCLHRAGYSHTGSARAGSFATDKWVFHGLEKPKFGCVIVTGTNTGNHVGFLSRTGGLPRNKGRNLTAEEVKGIWLLGGNQGKRVRERRYSRGIIAGRGANGVTSPYMWPVREGNNCNCNIPTAHPHSCGYPHDH